jgi:hypothetical protein
MRKKNSVTAQESVTPSPKQLTTPALVTRSHLPALDSASKNNDNKDAMKCSRASPQHSNNSQKKKKKQKKNVTAQESVTPLPRQFTTTALVTRSHLPALDGASKNNDISQKKKKKKKKNVSTQESVIPSPKQLVTPVLDDNSQKKKEKKKEKCYCTRIGYSFAQAIGYSLLYW